MGGAVRHFMIIFNALQTSLSGGIGRYSYELAKAIYELDKIDFKIVIRKEDLQLFEFANVDDLVIVENIKNGRHRNLYEQFVLPKLIYKKFPEAVIHYPDTMAPLFAKNKVVITVHDLAFKSLKDAFTWKTTIWKNIITDLSINKANKIIAITNFAKNEILRHYNSVDKNKISVVYNGFNDFSKEPIDLEKVSEEISFLKNKSYILTVSTISPRKNIDGLINAFNLVKDKIDCDLVIAGNKGWLYGNVFNLVSNLNLKDRVIFTGGINDDELKFLYKNANLFIYPSFYEGFGLPPLEALSFNIPCVVSDATSMPEVLKESVEYFNPFLINNIGEKIVNVYMNNAVEKKSVNNNCLKNYSWLKCAENVIDLYKMMLNRDF